MEPEFDVLTAGLSPDAVMDEDGNLRAAFLLINLETFQISFHWLPDLFRRPMPKALRQEIVKRLRIHADKLESGEMERTMQQYVNINLPERSD